MEQRDLLKDQIEQLGKVLAKILSDFLGLKSNGQVTEGITAANERLQEELDIDVVKLVKLNKEELIHYLKTRKLAAEHLEILSDYLKEIGLQEKKSNPQKAEKSFHKAIELLDLADEFSNTKSFDRIHKKTAIQHLL